MAVYVDPLFSTVPKPGWRFREACHMVADTEAELHEMADRLGMRRSWFQRHSRLPHYDLTRNKRFQAVRLGAVELTRRELVERFLRAWESKDRKDK